MIHGQASDWASVLAGVPQCSILGPLLFLFFINDIVKHIGCSIRLFADDTSLYIIVDWPTSSRTTSKQGSQCHFDMGKQLACNLQPK